MAKIIGIDLGTTNSVGAVVRGRGSCGDPNSRRRSDLSVGRGLQ